MNKSPLPNTRAFRLIWQVAPFLDWLFRSIRWRVKACYDIGYWMLILGAPYKYSFGMNRDFFGMNRGQLVKCSWNLWRELEFPRIKIDTWSPPIQVEVMQPVMGFKHNSEGQLEQTFKMKAEPIKLRTIHDLRPMTMCTDGKIRPIEEIK